MKTMKMAIMLNYLHHINLREREVTSMLQKLTL